MSGISDLKEYLQNTINGSISSNIYLAKVISVKPLKLSNAFFDVLDEEQIHILDCRKKKMDDRVTTSDGKYTHSHTIKKDELRVGDEVLILLYEQELEQKFILIDKVVKYNE